LKPRSLRRIILRPDTLARSLAMSHRAQSTNGGLLPVVASGSTRFEIARDAAIETQGRVVFDYQYFAGSGWFGELPVGATRVRMAARSRLRMGSSVRIGGGTQIVVGPDAVVEIGASTYINPNSRILCAHAINIGRRCAVSWRVTIFDFIGAHSVVIDGRQLDDVAPVRIGDDVLIGAGATILRGVTIGAGSVVAAESVVTSDIPAGSLVAGNPARVISNFVSWNG
jgi:acetyltransferase-like isoleucine patch superfamily enzyme